MKGRISSVLHFCRGFSSGFSVFGVGSQALEQRGRGGGGGWGGS